MDVLGGAARALDVGEAFAAGGVIFAGGVFGPNRAADAGPQAMTRTAARQMRNDMEAAEQG